MFALLLVSFTIAQGTPSKTNTGIGNFIVTPGVGLGNLKLGMSEKQVTKLLGSKLVWYNYKKEMGEFKASSNPIAIDSQVQFVLGFDACAHYEEKPSLGVAPVYKLYFKNHKLNYFIISSYTGNKEQVLKTRMTNGMAFGDEMSALPSKMTSPYLQVFEKNYSGDYIYHENGVELIYDKEKLVVFSLFKPNKNLPQLIEKNRARLIVEFSK